MKFESVVNIRPGSVILSWLLLAALLTSVVENLLVGEFLWAGFGLLTIAVALLPPVLASDWNVMVSWKVLLLSALPAFTHLLDLFVPSIGYVSIAALGLLITAEIDQFTTAQMPRVLAGAMVVMATMSVASFWVTGRYFANLWLGTAFVTTVDALMWELIAASTIGVGFGLLFELWLRNREVN